MKTIINISSFKLSLFLLFLGIVFIILENIFYQYVDTDGRLHESFFLPLGAFSLLLGGAGLFFTLIWFYIKKKKNITFRKNDKTINKIT
jgi:hypothetical protein